MYNTIRENSHCMFFFYKYTIPLLCRKTKTSRIAYRNAGNA